MSSLTGYVDSREVHLSKTAQQQGSGDDDAGKKKKTAKRRKVNHACLYCRRSHMTCDEGRPCQRWWVLLLWIKLGRSFTLDPSIKRDIGHLCHDEQRPKVQDKPLEPTAAVPAQSYTPGIFFSFDYLHIYLLLSNTSCSVCSTTTANFLVAHVHPPVSLSTRDVWKRVFDPHVCPLYLLLVSSIT